MNFTARLIRGLIQVSAIFFVVLYWPAALVAADDNLNADISDILQEEGLAGGVWMTLANILLTAATAAFPLLILYGVIRAARQAASAGLGRATVLCGLAALQWIIVMAIYGQWPIALWL